MKTKKSKKTGTSTKLPLAIVEWEDACAHTNRSLQDCQKEKPFLVRTFGVAIKDKKYIYVMTHDGEEANSCDFMKIPKGLVKKITTLKVKK
jgi:hypothetical protein